MLILAGPTQDVGGRKDLSPRNQDGCLFPEKVLSPGWRGKPSFPCSRRAARCQNEPEQERAKCVCVCVCVRLQTSLANAQGLTFGVKAHSCQPIVLCRSLLGQEHGCLQTGCRLLHLQRRHLELHITSWRRASLTTALL